MKTVAARAETHSVATSPLDQPEALNVVAPQWTNSRSRWTFRELEGDFYPRRRHTRLMCRSDSCSIDDDPESHAL